jgi:hypothetical protein
MFGTMVVGIGGWELGKSVVAGAKAAPLPALLVGCGLGFLFWRYWNHERGREHRVGARTLLGDAARGIGAVWERAEGAKLLLEDAAFVPDSEPTLEARVARILAIAPIPPRAAEAGERLEISTQKATSVLRAPMFVRSSEGRYFLGSSPIGDELVVELQV